MRDGTAALWADMILAGGVAMLVAFVSIHVMLTIIQRVGFMPFVICIILGTGLLAVIYL